jgi:hypothetical protein
MSKRIGLWKSAPAREDLEAARIYLSLIYSDAIAGRLARDLARTQTRRATAKDLLRASDLDLLSADESHVKQDLRRIRKGKTLAPVLLIRGDMSRGVPLVIADGYHRICAVCYFDEDAPVACRIVPLRR